MRRRLLTLLVAGAVGAIFAAGLFIDGRVGGALLIATAAILVGLARITWAHLKPQARPLRIVLIAAIGVGGAIKVIHG
jgi:hypothetical protein